MMGLKMPVDDLGVVILICGNMDVLRRQQDQAEHTECAQNRSELSAKTT
jgi:hypothetical protein